MTQADSRTTRLRTLADLIVESDDDLWAGRGISTAVVPTGMLAIDEALAGGFRSGELVLLAGTQGLGKTTFALQIVRNVAHEGGRAVMFSYEHESGTLLERLLSLEAAAAGSTAPVHAIRRALERPGPGGLAARLDSVPGGAAALRAVTTYADRLYLVEATARHTDLDEIERVVRQVHGDGREPVLVAVDYLQKVPVHGVPDEERTTVVVEALKDLTLTLDLPVLAIVASEKDSLAPGRRMRAQDLRGSSALAYEADIILVMADKHAIVARHHLLYDSVSAQRFHDWVVVTVEKNRHGVGGVDLEFEKHLESGRFHPQGRRVQETLIEERVFIE